MPASSAQSIGQVVMDSSRFNDRSATGDIPSSLIDASPSRLDNREFASISQSGSRKTRYGSRRWQC
jgi:hypothetical protein